MIVIGRKDLIDFPEWELFKIEAKIDTGAYGSAIHCHHMEIVEQNGMQKLRFQLLDPSHPEYEDKFYYTEDFETKIVKSSSGQAEERFALKTKVKIFNKVYLTRFSLTNRSEMKNPVLLGRKFLRSRFIVDVNRKNLSFKNQKIEI